MSTPLLAAGETPPRTSCHRVLVLRCPDWPADADNAAAGGSGGLSGSGGSGGSGGSSPRDAAARAFEAVVAIVEAFCPQVEVLRPGVCAIPARGPARYFGGEAELARKLAEAVGRAGYPCQVGVADGLFAAGLAARSGPTGVLVPPGQAREFLAGFGVGVLGLPELCELLPRLGIETLGQLATLPPAQAASRFGPEGKLACRLARGLDPRPLLPRPPSADLSAVTEFDPPAQQSEPVVFAAKALADQMHDRLAAAGLACVRVRVEVHCADGRELTRLWRHDGLLSALAVAERVRWQLDGAALGGNAGHTGQSPAAGITLLRLVPDQLVRAAGRQLALWGDPVISDRVARAAIRVQAMLGHAHVTRPVLAGGRRAAEQVLLVPFGDTGTAGGSGGSSPRASAAPRPADRPWPGQIPPPSPATVYAEPLPASVTDADRQAVTVSGRAQVSAAPAWLSAAGGPVRAVTAWAGPWPVTQRWWDSEHACRQARFQLVTDDGNAWLAAITGGCWQVEGRYD